MPAADAESAAVEQLAAAAARIAELEAVLATAQQQSAAAADAEGDTGTSAVDTAAANAAEVQRLR